MNPNITVKWQDLVGVVFRIITLNFLAEHSDEPCPIHAAITLSSPINIFEGSDELEKWHNIALNKYLTRDLIQTVKRLAFVRCHCLVSSHSNHAGLATCFVKSQKHLSFIFKIGLQMLMKMSYLSSPTYR